VTTVTTRLPANATRSAPAPPRTARRGRPRLKGDRLGTAAARSANTAPGAHTHGHLYVTANAAVTCADNPVRSANSRTKPIPACDTTPRPSADTFTRAAAAIPFTRKVLLPLVPTEP